MNKYQSKKVNNFLPDIPINEDSKDKLFSLASSHNLSELEEFITTNSISLNVKNNNEKNQTIMHVLLEGESPTDEEELLRCIKFLVERGAPISSIDNSNLTPLFICIKKKYPKIFKFLLHSGASLDINTNDDLTVLHEIAKPEYTTYDAKGIQDLIPEKLPKITMKGYEEVYKQIIDAIQTKLNNDTLYFSIFKNIAKQFYYHDENEDFNNELLLKEASNNPNIKNELFLKLQNQLKDFYTSDTIEDVNIQDLNGKLDDIIKQLNLEFNMNKYNLLNEIKFINYYLEISNKFSNNNLNIRDNNYFDLCKLYKLTIDYNNHIYVERLFTNETYNENDYFNKLTIDFQNYEGYVNIIQPNNINTPYTFNFFNLLYTFNQEIFTNYNVINIDNNIFNLYQQIKNFSQFNYLIYIYEKEKEKISNLKFNNYDNNETKKHLDDLFNTSFKELEKSINLIKEQLTKIEKLSNEYIDIYNKINGNKIYTDTNPIYIGIYPKIQFPTKIKYTLDEEDTEIGKIRGNYVLYNKYKNDFFHNFVLYFQDIGIYDTRNFINNSLLNNITNAYNIVIGDYNQYYNNIYNVFRNVEELNQYNQDNKNNAYKLYYYNPIYLKLEKQKIVKDLSDNVINTIDIPKFNNYNTTIAGKLTIEIKNKILNEIIEEKFNNILVIEINNFLKKQLSIKTEELVYKFQIKEPDFNAILLSSVGFSSILIPNYEFKNNKFLSISKNKFLEFKLYFDTNYFKVDNLNTLKYYKENKFITELLNKNKSLLLKTDIKGWTPIYYAIDGNNYQVIEDILNNKEIDTLIHYDHKKISPLKLCINKQLNHLNYLLTEDNEIHYLHNYIKLLKNELKSNNLLIPLNIESIFIIALFIQNHIWSENAKNIILDPSLPKNTRKKQINEEYNDLDTTSSDVNNDDFNYGDNVNNNMDKPDIIYKIKQNTYYNYNDIDYSNDIIKKYYKKANDLEKQDFGLYGSYWKNYEKYIKNKYKFLVHISNSLKLKETLVDLRDTENPEDKFNLPSYNKTKIIKLKTTLNKIKKQLERYLKFINIRFNSNKNNAYNLFLNKIYVHVLANIIGVDFYLKMEELIVKHYMNLNIDIDQSIPDPTNATKKIYPVKDQLKNLNNLLINNKLDDSNINYKYISATKNPELVLKKDIIDILNNEFISNNEELINIFETKIYPNYRDLYKITYKYLQMFISNYHKFIYNQYHGLEILLLLLDKISS